jgi:Flp pilus assembly protein TadG
MTMSCEMPMQVKQAMKARHARNHKHAATPTRQRGAQAVEFALVLPFFLVLLMLTIDFGFLMLNKAVITNASREAARAGSLLSATAWSPSDVAAVACNYVKSALISTSQGSRTVSCSGTADPVIVVSNLNGNLSPQMGDPIRVQVTYAYQGLLNSLWGSSQGQTPGSQTLESVWTLTATSTMRHE